MDDYFRQHLDEQEQRFAVYEAEAEALRAALIAAGADEKEARAIDRDRMRFCGDSPAARIAKYRAITAREREERRAHFLAQMSRAGAAPLHVRAVVEAAPQEWEALAHARQFVERNMVFLVLSGGVGVGKSGAAAWALAEWNRTSVIDHGQRFEGKFVRPTELTRIAGFGDDERAFLKELERTPFLVLDDLGCEYVDAKGFFMAHLVALIDRRYGDAAKTLITTNLGAAAFKERYGERVADRIKEFGVFTAIAGPSKRKRREFLQHPVNVGPAPASDFADVEDGVD